MHRFLLLNPNTSASTTAMMLAIAREALAGAAAIEGVTAASGAPVITDPAALAVAALEVGRRAASANPALSGLLVAAFGDPGLEPVRARLDLRVTGLAEAAILAAGEGGRRFAIVTTTPALDAVIRARVAATAGSADFAGIRYTRSGPAAMADPARLHDELAEACARAVSQDGAAAIVIGGGPLVEPVPAAMQLMLARAAA